jgi:hypothetical protein
MIDANRFRVNDKTKAAQTEKSRQSHQKRRQIKEMYQTPHDAAGENTDAERDGHSQERITSSLHKPGNQDPNKSNH